MDNPEKLATLSTQDTRRRQKKQNTTQYMLDTTIRKQKQITKTCQLGSFQVWLIL